MEHTPPERQSAELLFTAFLLLFSVFLLSQLGNQITYAQGQPFFKQPGLWTLIGLTGWALGCFFHLLQLWRAGGWQHPLAALWSELSVWGRSLEFLGWFLGYVWIVPHLGYLLATLLFGLLLTLRLGYVSRRLLLSSVLVSLSTVVIFKSLLQAKIPGGALYELLPMALRNFMVTYF